VDSRLAYFTYALVPLKDAVRGAVSEAKAEHTQKACWNQLVTFG